MRLKSRRQLIRISSCFLSCRSRCDGQVVFSTLMDALLLESADEAIIMPTSKRGLFRLETRLSAVFRPLCEEVRTASAETHAEAQRRAGGDTSTTDTGSFERGDKPLLGTRRSRPQRADRRAVVLAGKIPRKSGFALRAQVRTRRPRAQQDEDQSKLNHYPPTLSRAIVSLFLV
jgi:hypothetical protein